MQAEKLNKGSGVLESDLGLDLAYVGASSVTLVTLPLRGSIFFLIYHIE